jgi:hypothetical protein
MKQGNETTAGGFRYFIGDAIAWLIGRLIDRIALSMVRRRNRHWIKFSEPCASCAAARTWIRRDGSMRCECACCGMEWTLPE